jgi:methionyl-tRNA formyltransferase
MVEDVVSAAGERLRVVFMGSDPIALPLLNTLAASPSVELVGVFTQPDRATGRGQRVVANAIKQWAEAGGLPIVQPLKFDESARETLAAFASDLSLVMAYGHILRTAVIETPRLGTLNLHTSILPRYRGASPIQTAVAEAERETGVSLMRMALALDAGPVAAVERVSIEALDTAETVEAKLAEASRAVVMANLARIATGELVFHEQDDTRATYCRRLNKGDGALDFAASAAVLAARINGLFPWPTCQVETSLGELKLGLAEALPDASSAAPGTVLGADAEGLRVATGEGTLRVRRLQRPGGRMLTAVEFLRGATIGVGTVLPSAPMAPLVADRPFRAV